jgi:hypothetical protein
MGKGNFAVDKIWKILIKTKVCLKIQNQLKNLNDIRIYSNKLSTNKL